MGKSDLKSAIVRNLQPEFEPVALVWSNTIPNDTFQFKKGKFGCILNLFAVASQRGKIAGGSRETITCTGGRAALGLGFVLDASDEILERNVAGYSKGLKSASNQEAYRAHIEASPKSWRSNMEYGERRFCNAELAREWLLHGLPRYDIPYKYVLFKPLNRTIPDDNIRAVIFPVNPVELAGLITLAGSVMHGTESVRVTQGSECNNITAFTYAEAESAAPRAVLGMTGIEGREIMRKFFRDDILTLTLPTPLFHRLEQEADDCIFQTPLWKALVGSGSLVKKRRNVT